MKFLINNFFSNLDVVGLGLKLLEKLKKTGKMHLDP